MSKKTRTHLISGFAGGLTSAIILQPFDLLKTRVQQSTHSTLLSSIRELKHVSELWRGTLPSALRTSIGSALYLTFLNSIRVYLSKFHSQATRGISSSSQLVKLSPQENLATGMFARGVIGWVTMPFTIVKVRYESNLYNYKSFNGALKSILKTEGTKGFFKGYWATTARDAPYAGIYVLFYEQMKQTIPTVFNLIPNDQLFSSSTSAVINTSSAMVSASLATIITGPFDTIKTNMQLHPQYKFTETCTVLYNKGGFKRFFDGLSLRLVRKGFSAGIAWCLYEELVKYFQ